VITSVGERTRLARELFAPLGPTYDRYARLLSFGQDPRWRTFLVSRIETGPGETVLDVASGTGAVAIEIARRRGSKVVGIDQSPEMLAVGRGRVAQAGLTHLVRLEEGRAEALPFPDASFDALTFTYLLRYVDNPGAVLVELARVVRPGGAMAMLEFHVPANRVARVAWEAYIRVGLPAAGRLLSPAWGEVGSFLGPSIRRFWERYPLTTLLELWRRAGIRRPQIRALSLGGGVVIWGDRDG
jgi:demethylmenaquinone methyltransferase / 2-methoxy-6-polyprenyl-1,4-benzoquinol methylase